MVAQRTEELLASTTFFNDLDQTRLQLLNRRDMVGQNTHLARLGGYIDLNAEVRIESAYIAHSQLIESSIVYFRNAAAT